MVQYISKKKIEKFFDNLIEKFEEEDEDLKGIKLIRDEILKL